jgi:alkylation response protein AidB-like acyl-CoA dehydrogenase
VDFSFDETQQQVADLAGTVLRAEPDHGRTEAALASSLGYDETAWKAMSQAGLPSLAVPAEQGGDGLGPVEILAVLHAVGRQTLPLPALATLALGVLPLAGTAAAGDVLAGVCDGAVLTGALRDVPGHMVTVRDGAISGRKAAVPYAAQAGHLVVSAGDRVVVVAGDAVRTNRTSTASGLPEYTVSFEAAPILFEADCTPAELADFAAFGATAVAAGVIDGALALTADHIRSRQQFDRVLATFQGVAMQAADVYIAARTTNLLARSAAWRLGAGLDATDDLDVASYWITAEALPALQTCHHLHGGLGVDITYPLHRYYSLLKDLARATGGVEAGLSRIGARCSSN